MSILVRWWKSPLIRWLVGVMIGALSLYLALRDIHWSDVSLALQQAEWSYMGLALVSVIIGFFAKVIRWRVLMGENGRKVSFLRLAMSHLAGQSLNMVYPARAGDLSRVYVIGEVGISRMYVLGTVVLEKLWDMLSYTLIFILLLFLIPLPVWVSESVYSITFVTLIFFFMSFVISYQRTWVFHQLERLIKWLPEKYRDQLMMRIHAGAHSLDVMQNRKGLFWLAFWSTIAWASAVLNNQLVLLSLRLHLPLTASILILVALQVGISLPTIPGRLGIFQYICVLALSLYGIDQSLAFSYSILLHSVALLTILLSGLVCVWVFGMMGQKFTRMETT
jgi:uncharacterized protein (TIRG00374 family)